MNRRISFPAPRFLKLLSLALLLLSLAPACGYRVVGSEPVSPGKSRATLAIPPFENRSMQPGLETVFANDMIRVFQESKVFQVKPGEAKADYVLLGTIKTLEHSSTAYLDIERSLIRRATIAVEIKLQDNRTNKVVWKNVETIKSDYVANLSYGIGEATRDQGIRQASVRLAQRVNDKIGMLF
jgi:hypothetical protein